MQKTWNRLTFIVNFVGCIENVIKWYGDGWDTLMNDAKMCMMIRGAANPLWLMKTWCVQWREDSREQTIHHFVTFPAHSVLGQKTCSACGILASRLNSQHSVYCNTLRNWVVRSRTSDVACLVGVLWCFMTMPAHTLSPQRKIHRDIWLGTIRSSPLQTRLSAKLYTCVHASENVP
jgi:hypothetical protein